MKNTISEKSNWFINRLIDKLEIANMNCWIEMLDKKVSGRDTYATVSINTHSFKWKELLILPLLIVICTYNTHTESAKKVYPLGKEKLL